MAPEFGDTQVIAPQASSASSVVETAVVDQQRVMEEVSIEDAHLPSMEDLDELVADLDVIDATLAELR